MKTFSIAAALIAVSFSAMADGASYEYPQVTSSTLTRAQVRAQTADAAARGELVSGELSYVAAPQGPSLTRAQVRAELAAARANNELFHGEIGFVMQSRSRDPMSVLGARGDGILR